MELMNLFKERYSVRKFSDKKVEQEKINCILEAGRLAPTAVNFQPQKVYVLESQESLEKLKKCTNYHFNAPLAMLICYNNTTSWKRGYDGKDMGEVDASIVATHMMLEITNLGLGTTWVGHFDPEKVIEEYKLPQNIIPVAIFPIGYPQEGLTPNPRHYDRVELDKTVKFI